jgi:hypothetical protein
MESSAPQHTTVVPFGGGERLTGRAPRQNKNAPPFRLASREVGPKLNKYLQPHLFIRYCPGELFPERQFQREPHQAVSPL